MLIYYKKGGLLFLQNMVGMTIAWGELMETEQAYETTVSGIMTSQSRFTPRVGRTEFQDACFQNPV